MTLLFVVWKKRTTSEIFYIFIAIISEVIYITSLKSMLFDIPRLRQVVGIRNWMNLI